MATGHEEIVGRHICKHHITAAEVAVKSCIVAQSTSLGAATAEIAGTVN